MSDLRPMIGLSQRITVAPPHGEKRDSLARDWHPFLKALGVDWIALPNDIEAAVGLASRLDLTGVILTGGDNVGDFPERDAAEAALLDWAQAHRRPVIGVCRGFQFIHCRLGGRLVAVPPDVHRARTHEIVVERGERRVVNSYHNFSPDFEGGPHLMRPLAVCAIDGAVEAAIGDGLLGVMWHPEREPIPQPEDLALFAIHFQIDK